MSARNPSLTLARLRRQWLLVAALYGLALLVGYLWLAAQLSPPRALQWALLAGLLLALELLVLGRNLHKNSAAPHTPLRSGLGWGNGVSLARGLAYGAMAGFLFAPRPGGLLDWLPALLYTGAIAADYLDGYLARITHHTTLLGEILDIEFDGIGILIAMTLAVQYGQLPPLILLLAVSRPLFLWGMKWREGRGLPNHPMTPSDERRIVAGLLMGFMAILLWPVFTPPATWLAAAAFGGAVALSFLRDWLVVIGWLQPASPAYTRWRLRLKGLLFEWLPLLLRMAALPAAVWLLWTLQRQPGAWSSHLAAPPGALLIGLGLLAGGAALLGLIGRLAALGLVALACADLIVRGDSPATLLLLGAGILLLLVGNGKAALWTPDERLLRRRAGQRAAGGEQPS